MRWGVPLEAADDHQATALCMEEIRNCQKLSTGPNFVVYSKLIQVEISKHLTVVKFVPYWNIRVNL